MRVLIVDDEVVIRKGIVKLLENFGRTITETDEARNGEEALQRLIDKRPDMIITDIQMPVMNGLELIARVRESNPELEIIVLSGYAEFEYVQQALRYQVTDYLLKPVTQERLDEVISKVLLKDPSKWTAQMNADSIRFMKETAAALIKNVLAEHKAEANRLIDDWGAYCKSQGYTLLELKRIMGHFQLFFRSELLLSLKQDAGGQMMATPQPASTAEELFEGWKSYVADVIARVSERRAPRNKRVVEEVMSQIDSRYGDAALNLQALADHSGVSSPYLSKIFREVMKKPITQYISEYRLEKARERLMGEDSAKINLIAEQCGFNDYPYFSKIFKKYFGVSPLEYKEKNS